MKCKTCNEVFSNISSFSHHWKLMHCNSATKFNCIKCGKTFSRKYALTRHIKNIHLQKEFPESNLQVSCMKYDTRNEVFSNESCLFRNQDMMHRNSAKKFDCGQCNKVFSRKYSLVRHIINIHPVKEFLESNFQNVYFECSDCGMKFLRKDNLKNHISQRHAEDEFECHHCGVKLRYKKSIVRHLWTKCLINKQCYDKMTQTCALCEYSSSKKSDIQHHYKIHHKMPLMEKQLNFNSYLEFLTWKIGIEDTTNSRFVIRNTHKGKSDIVKLFCCHRSGIQKIKSADRKRRPRLKGSKKIGFICPAEMRVRCSMINSTCIVSFCDTHVGHDLTNRKEIGTLYPRRKDITQLLNKTAVDVSLNRMLDDYQNDDILENYLLPNLKKSDLNNDLCSTINTFNASYKNNSPRSFLNDEQNTEIFVKRYEPYILYYKKRHEMPLDNKFPNLRKEDIVLIFMCNSQKLLLQKHGNNIIAIDSTHNLNFSGFTLQTILILDYDGEDYPVAFALSNRYDSVVIDVFLSCVRQAVGIIQPKTLMTNTEMTYFNSWQKIMKMPRYHFFCVWYVLNAWRRKKKKIMHKGKRKQILFKLYELISEINIDTFSMYLNELLNTADDDTSEFLDYIQTEFGTNVERWAYCYRVDVGVNFNLHLEAFQRALQFIHREGKKINNLYSGLEFIRTYLYRELNSINIKYTHGRITTKLKYLREIHDRASKTLAENNKILVVENEDGWSVESCKESDDYIREVYFVQRICEKCPAIEDNDYRECNLECSECGACAHLYRCTCIQNTVKNHMCEHIHIALTISNETKNKSTASVDTGIH